MRRTFADGRIEVRLGDWREVLAEVAECDALITDPPYSERTHAGALDPASGARGVTGYAAWSEADAEHFISAWIGRVRTWIVIHTDDTLAPHIRACMERHGRYAFPAVPVLQHAPRVMGDGPGPPGHFLVVSRPRERRMLSWGSLPGWYEARRDGSIVRGGKPLELMRAIVRHYSRPGDLVVDSFGGGLTTALACAMEGRRCITSEIDPETFEKGCARLARGHDVDMFSAATPQGEGR